MAEDNAQPALLIVEEDGAQVTRTFAELARRSNQTANFLRALGVKRGDRILVMLGNQPELWEFFLAGMKLGAVLVPSTPLLTAEDLRDRLERGSVRHVIAAEGQTGKFDSLTGDYTRVVTSGAGERMAPISPERCRALRLIHSGRKDLGGRCLPPLLHLGNNGQTKTGPALASELSRRAPFNHVLDRCASG